MFVFTGSDPFYSGQSSGGGGNYKAHLSDILRMSPLEGRRLQLLEEALSYEDPALREACIADLREILEVFSRPASLTNYHRTTNLPALLNALKSHPEPAAALNRDLRAALKDVAGQDPALFMRSLHPLLDAPEFLDSVVTPETFETAAYNRFVRPRIYGDDCWDTLHVVDQHPAFEIPARSAAAKALDEIAQNGDTASFLELSKILNRPFIQKANLLADVSPASLSVSIARIPANADLRDKQASLQALLSAYEGKQALSGVTQEQIKTQIENTISVLADTYNRPALYRNGADSDMSRHARYGLRVDLVTLTRIARSNPEWEAEILTRETRRDIVRNVGHYSAENDFSPNRLPSLMEAFSDRADFISDAGSDLARAGIAADDVMVIYPVAKDGRTIFMLAAHPDDGSRRRQAPLMDLRRDPKIDRAQVAGLLARDDFAREVQPLLEEARPAFG